MHSRAHSLSLSLCFFSRTLYDSAIVATRSIILGITGDARLTHARTILDRYRGMFQDELGMRGVTLA